ncbi:MerR family transcriptional regulator [Streptosporangium sp. NPDC051023]|uniref:MerR family transcriptional regulator n=1 Tax=Streptosporangium sp. NPDC051023 TaxID=3155410 RepID=UPI00344E8F74
MQTSTLDRRTKSGTANTRKNLITPARGATPSPSTRGTNLGSSNREMKIGELARETDVSPRLLRYYEEQGLLTSHRSESGHRHYTPETPTIVRHIRTLLAAGLPTRTIRDILPCIEGPGPDLHPCVRNYLQDHLKDLDTQITTLQQSRSSIAALLTATEKTRA